MLSQNKNSLYLYFVTTELPFLLIVRPLPFSGSSPIRLFVLSFPLCPSDPLVAAVEMCPRGGRPVPGRLDFTLTWGQCMSW